MSNLINIQGKNEIIDPNYRYKMTQLNIITEGAFTAITNIPQVSKDIERDPLMFVEFIKHKLGINLTYKDNKLKYSSKINKNAINDALNEFIDMFVLCSNCNLPETNMFIKKDKGTIEFDCRACSYNITINVSKVKVDKHIQKTCQAIVSKGMRDCVKELV